MAMKPPKPPEAAAVARKPHISGTLTSAATGILRTCGTRREFFRAAARYTALSVIGLVASYLLGRKSQGACTNRSVCGSCPLWVDCTLPPALARKAVESENPNGIPSQSPGLASPRAYPGKAQAGNPTPTGLRLNSN
jgi:hypothetical protein